jgi:hypothetical protein
VISVKNDGSRQEETWVRDGKGWKLQNATAIAGAPASKSM